MLKSGLNGAVIELGFERKVVGFAGDATAFQLAKGQQRSKDVVLLGVRQFGGRLG